MATAVADTIAPLLAALAPAPDLPAPAPLLPIAADPAASAGAATPPAIAPVAAAPPATQPTVPEIAAVGTYVPADDFSDHVDWLAPRPWSGSEPEPEPIRLIEPFYGTTALRNVSDGDVIKHNISIRELRLI